MRPDDCCIHFIRVYVHCTHILTKEIVETVVENKKIYKSRLFDDSGELFKTEINNKNDIENK